MHISLQQKATAELNRKLRETLLRTLNSWYSFQCGCCEPGKEKTLPRHSMRHKAIMQ